MTVSNGPLALDLLQDFCQSSMLSNVVRMKGILCVASSSSAAAAAALRCVLHLSGRGRLSFEVEGPWTGGQRSSRSRSLGRGSTKLLTSASGGAGGGGGGWRLFLLLLLLLLLSLVTYFIFYSSACWLPLFDLYDGDDGGSGGPGYCCRFRSAGCKAYGYSCVELRETTESTSIP